MRTYILSLYSFCLTLKKFMLALLLKFMFKRWQKGHVIFFVLHTSNHYVRLYQTLDWCLNTVHIAKMIILYLIPLFVPSPWLRVRRLLFRSRPSFPTPSEYAAPGRLAQFPKSASLVWKQLNTKDFLRIAFIGRRFMRGND